MTIDSFEARAQSDRAPIREPGVFDISLLEVITRDKPDQRAVLKALLSTMSASSRAELAGARNCWESGNLPQAAKILHGLRGSVGTVGATRFAAATIALERELLQGTDGISELFSAAMHELSGTISLAEIWLEQDSA